MSNVEVKEDSDQHIERMLEKLSPLLGTWQGRGRGEFPTIDPFEYRESFSVTHDTGAPFFHYQQSTDICDAAGAFIRKSHWETGVIRPLEDGRIEIACVHNSGRVEVLHGEFIEDAESPHSIALRFKSELIANDERMCSSQREWFIDNQRFRYVMSMATTKIAESTFHLESVLSKSI